jgi:ubiquitin-conjugating enzyme E2 M
MQVYHPNIDLEGNVCLNILREDWKPVLNINTIIYGLFHLFTVLIILTKVHSCN